MLGKNLASINKTYDFWRKNLMLSMIIGYATFYLTRKSVNFVMPVMQTELHLDKGDIGWIASLFYLTYGLSKFLSGIFHDQYGYRWFMGAGLVMTGVMNIIFAYCLSFPALLLVWALLMVSFKDGVGPLVQGYSPIGIHVMNAVSGGDYGIYPSILAG